MSLYWEFPVGWWAVILIIYGLYFLIFLQRKGYQRKNEIKIQLVFASVALLIAFVIELVGVNLKVWTYASGNWPIIIWPTYFGAGLLCCQLIKKIEEIYE